MTSPAVTRARHIHQARVYLAQARAFRLRDPRKPRAGLWLLEWAGNRRRQADALPKFEQFHFNWERAS